MTGQLQTQRREADAGRLVIDLGGVGEAAELEQRLRTVLRDPTLRGPALVGLDGGLPRWRWPASHAARAGPGASA